MHVYNTSNVVGYFAEESSTMPSSTINFNATIDLAAPLERLWPLISDTDRVNRMVGLPAFDSQRLALGVERLRQFGIRPALVERLAAHLATADDPDVLRMRPFALADRWGEPRLDVLRMFLYATRSGLLDLEWDVLCPNC